MKKFPKFDENFEEGGVKKHLPLLSLVGVRGTQILHIGSDP